MATEADILSALSQPISPSRESLAMLPALAAAPIEPPPELQGQQPLIQQPAGQDALLSAAQGLGLSAAQGPPAPSREGFFKRTLVNFLQGFSAELTRPEREFQLQKRQVDIQEQVAKMGNEPITLTGPNGEQVTIPIKYASPYVAGGFRVQAAQAQIQSREKISAAQIASRQGLLDAQADLARMRTEVLRGQVDPNSPAFKIREKELDKRLAVAWANNQLRQQSLDLAERRLEVAIDRMYMPTSGAKDRASFAASLRSHIPEIQAEVVKLGGDLGPLQGRWNDIMTGNIGVLNAKYWGLATKLSLLASGLMVPHVGARGGVNLLERFDKLFATKLDPANLGAALTAADSFLEGYERLPEVQRGLMEQQIPRPGAKKPAAETKPDFVFRGGKLVPNR